MAHGRDVGPIGGRQTLEGSELPRAQAEWLDQLLVEVPIAVGKLLPPMATGSADGTGCRLRVNDEEAGRPSS